MTSDKSWVRILIYNDCGTEKFLNVFFPVPKVYQTSKIGNGNQLKMPIID